LKEIDYLTSIDEDIKDEVVLKPALNVKDISIYSYQYEGINGIILR
jgi:hypothetical protein